MHKFNTVSSTGKISTCGQQDKIKIRYYYYYYYYYYYNYYNYYNYYYYYFNIAYIFILYFLSACKRISASI